MKTAFSFSFGGELVRILSSVALFLLLAIALGVVDYGFWAGLYALASLFVPLVALGAGHVASRRVPHALDTPREAVLRGVGATLTGIAVAAPVFVVAGVLLVGPVNLPLVLSLLVSEVVVTALVEVTGQVAFAARTAKVAFLLRLSLALPRTLAAVVFAQVVDDGNASLTVWALVYAGATALGAIGVLAVVVRWVGFGAPLRPTRDLVKEGLPFSLNLAAAYAQDDFDKVILLGQAGPAAVGIYAAGFRLAALSVAPVRAVLNVVYPQFYRAGRDWSQMRRLVSRLSAAGVVYGLVAGAILWFAGPPIVSLLGPSFQGTEPVLQALAFFPLTRGLSNVLGNAASGAGAQPVRGTVHLVAAALSITLNLALIPQLSYYACVIALFTAEVLSIVTFVIVLLTLRRRGAIT